MKPIGSIKDYHSLGRRVIVEPIKVEDEIIDGIIIPDTVANKNNADDGIIGIKCRLLDKAEDCEAEAKGLSVGDIIYAKPYAFEEIRFNEGLFYSIDEGSIRGKFASKEVADKAGNQV